MDSSDEEGQVPLQNNFVNSISVRPDTTRVDINLEEISRLVHTGFKSGFERPIETKENENLNIETREESSNRRRSSMLEGSLQGYPESFWSLSQQSLLISNLSQIEEKNLEGQRLNSSDIYVVLSELLLIENEKPEGKRLNNEQVFFFMTRLLKEKNIGEKVDFIIDEIRKIEEKYGLELKRKVQSAARRKAAKIPTQGPIFINKAMTYQKILDMELKQLTKNVIYGHTSTVCSVCITPNGKFILTGSADETIRVWNTQKRKELFTLHGHTSTVRSVAVSPDGKFIISGSGDCSIKIWNFLNKSQEFTLLGHSSFICSVAMSKDNKFIISASDDETIKLWDFQSKKVVHTFLGHSNRVRSVAISSDCRVIASGSDDTTVKLWDIIRKAHKFTMRGHNNYVRSVVMTPDDKFVISGSDDKSIKVWNISKGVLEFTLSGHTGSVWSVAVTPDGKFIISGSDDEIIRLWNIKEKRILGALSGHTGFICSVSISPDGKNVISGSGDKTIRIWKLNALREKSTLSKPESSVYSVAITPDSNYIVSGSDDFTVKIWNVQETIEKESFEGHIGFVRSVFVSPDGKFVVSGSDDDTVKIWNFGEKNAIFTFTGHASFVNSVVVTKNSLFIVSGSNDKTIKVWNICEKKEEFTLIGHSYSVCALALTPNGKNIISGSADQTVKIWNFFSKKEEFTLTGHTGTVRSLAVTLDGLSIVSGSDDHTIKIWSILEHRELFTFIGHQGCVNSVIISPDGKFIISGSEDKTIRIWTILDKKKICTLKGHTGPIWSVAVSPNGEYIVSGSEDKTLKIWDIREKSSVQGLKISILAMALSPDGFFFVTGSTDKNVQIWSTATKNIEYTLQGHSDVVYAVAISPDKSFIASGSKDKTVKIWKTETRTEEWTLRGHTGTVYSLAISPNCEYIATGSFDEKIKIWNLLTKTEERSLDGHTEVINSLSFTIDGMFIISASGDASIRIWGLQSIEEFVLLGHTGSVNSICLSGMGKFLVSGSDDKTVKMWNFIGKREEFSFAGHLDVVNTVALTPDERFILSGSNDGVIKIWNVEERRKEFQIGGDAAVRSLGITPDCKCIISASDCLTYWSVSECKEKLKIFSSDDVVTSIYIKNNGKQVLLKSNETVNHWKFKPMALKNCGIVPESSETSTLYNTKHYNCPVHCFTTADSKFSMVSNSEILDIIEKDLANESAYFHYWQTSEYLNPLVLYNLLDALESNDFSNVTPAALYLSYGQLGYTLLHYLAYRGDLNGIDVLTHDLNFTLKTDKFGKSAFYYAVIKKRQDCVDLLLEKVASLCDTGKLVKYQHSIFALRNDFALIINNSSKQLHLLLKNLLISSKVVYAKIPSNTLPVLQLANTINAQLEDFFQGISEETPVLLQSSRIPIIGSSGCTHNTDLLESIANCTNNHVLRIPIIRYIVELQWESLKKYVFLFTFLLFSNIILLILLIGLNTFDLYLVVLFLMINSILMAWEGIQMITNSKSYFLDPWNYIDIARFISSLIWIFLELFQIRSLYLRWMVSLLNLLRGITGFRLFDGTRFYIDLILKCLNDIKYFFVMFSYSTLAFGFLFMVSRDEVLSFDYIWGDSYSFNFGNYVEDPNNTNFLMNYIVYFGASVINVILMLNLLISILGDSYGQTQLEQSIVEVKEKAKNSLELQYMLFWTNRHSDIKYLNICNFGFEDEEAEDWEGQIRYMDKKLGKISPQIRSLEGKIKEINEVVQAKVGECSSIVMSKSASIKNKIFESKEVLEGLIVGFMEKGKEREKALQGRMEELELKNEGMKDLYKEIEGVASGVEKIEFKIDQEFEYVQSKIEGIEEKMDSIEKKIDMEREKGVERGENMENRIALVETKMILVSAQVKENHKKLEMILQILSGQINK